MTDFRDGSAGDDAGRVDGPFVTDGHDSVQHLASIPFGPSCPEYYSDWRSQQYKCPGCHWRGLGADLEQGGIFSECYELVCPRCGRQIVVLCFPTVEEAYANWDKVPEHERQQIKRMERRHAEFRKRKLSDGSQLPDILAPSFLLKWDVGGNGETQIKLGDRIIFREPGGWENYDRFVEVAEILRSHYGSAMVDLVPTATSFWSLNGDTNAEWPVAKARERIFGIRVKDQIPRWGKTDLGIPHHLWVRMRSSWGQFPLLPNPEQKF